MNRKKFIQHSVLGLTAANFIPSSFYTRLEDPIFSEEEITEFVFAAHSDLDKTKKIVDAKPLLLNCANQFKKGDFETAVGGASHMGRKDIADLLVGRGARLDIFNLTFLGYEELVKQLIKDFPQLLRAPGPHGFTLLHHAKVGKHDDFVSWIEDQGLQEDIFKDAFKTTK